MTQENRDRTFQLPRFPGGERQYPHFREPRRSAFRASSVLPRALTFPGDWPRAGIRRSAGSAPSPDSAAGVRVSPRQAACAEASDAVGQRRPRAAPARPLLCHPLGGRGAASCRRERGLPGRRSLQPPRGPAAHTAAHPRPPRAPPAPILAHHD